MDAFLPGVTAYLSEPKQQAFFKGPSKPLNSNTFLKKLTQRHLKPSPQTRILSLGKTVFCNGEDVTRDQAPKVIAAWNTLSANKLLKTSVIDNIQGSSLYEAYLAGWLIFEQ
jgi:50S ribosomal protein L16 3-hydroxylase